MGLFLLTSFYNHSCEPNACVYFFNNSLAYIIAQREIEAGEEITINYIDVEIEVMERRKILKENYGFDCFCPKCLRELSEIKEEQN